MKRKFGFMFMIFAMISLASCESKGKKITCKPENFREKISELKSEGTYNVIVSGTISNDKKFITDLSDALKQDRSVKIYLDLSETKGLKTFSSGASNLLGVSLPPSIGTLYSNSFLGKNIKYVDFPKGNKNFSVENEKAIYKNNPKTLLAVLQTAKELKVSEGTERIAKKAINNHACLEKVTLPSTVKEVGSFNFYDCHKLISVTGKVKAEEIWSNFENCPLLKLVDFEDSQVKSFMDCFRKLPDTHVKLPETVNYIGGCFLNSEFTNIKIPESVKNLSGNFYNLDNITDIELPKSVEVVKECFYNCKNLKHVNFGNNLKVLVRGFVLCPELKLISLPASLVRLQNSPYEWKFGIELSDPSNWVYATYLVQIVGETSINQEITSSPEKLIDFMNNSLHYRDEYNTVHSVSYYNGIWKSGYDISEEVLKQEYVY